MKNKWIKRAVWLLLTPLILFVALMVLLYVPPVQSFLRSQAATMASEATNMEISVERIDLRFPLRLLVRGILVVRPIDERVQESLQRDTLLSLGTLNVHVQALPLLQGKIEVDDITLEEVKVNSADLLEGMHVQGNLGRFFLQSHGVNLSREEVTLNTIELSDTHVQVLLADTTQTVPDSTGTSTRWRVLLQAMRLKDVSVNFSMPLDSIQLSAHVGEARIDDALADLGRQAYACTRFRLVDTDMRYDAGTQTVQGTGFDASHIFLRDITVGVDSVKMDGDEMNLLIQEFSLNERSGLSITSLTGALAADSSAIKVPELHLQTPHSEISFAGQIYRELLDIPTNGHLSANLDARIGKQDVLLFAGDLPDTFKDAYPFHPLIIHAGTEGNLTQMQISRLTADLPGAFSLSGTGELWHLTDSVTRNGWVDLEMQTQDLNFLTALADASSDNLFIVPDSINLLAQLRLKGTECAATMNLREQQGELNLDASYNLADESYRADITVDSLQIHHFLPKDSIYTLSVKAKARGKGIDFTSPHTVASAQISLEELQYASWHLSNVNLDAKLKTALASINLSSDNTLLKMQADASMYLNKSCLDGKVNLDVANLDVYKLGLAPRPLQRPFAFTLKGEARQDSIGLRMDAGDMNLRFRAHSTLEKLLKQSDDFVKELTAQLDERHLDHAALRRVLPSAGMHLKAGKENPVSYYLATKDIRYDDLKLSFGCTPQVGINGRTAIHGLRLDTLQLDTIFFSITQDTTRMHLQGGIVNTPRNPQHVFRSTVTGEIRNEDAELTANYVDGEGRTGILFGINARPLSEGNGKGNGVLFHFIPQEPIIAFRQFHFVDQCDWVYLHKDMHVYADVDMESDDGVCFRLKSDRQDTLSLQNMNIELSRFRLSELTGVIPYMPHITGLLSAEAKYIQTTNSLQLSADATVEDLTYERQSVGDVGVGVTWLPGEERTHYLNSYLLLDNEEVLIADATVTGKEGNESMEVNTTFQRFPLKVANAFIPEQMLSLTGKMDGEVALTGTVARPDIQGSLSLDSVSVYARQVGARYWLDKRPLRIENNRLRFNDFSIYTTNNNPFTINGDIDFRKLERPTANLSLKAENYTLLDASRTRESLVYGKVFVDLQATVRGPLDELTMRGNMNLLGNTDVTYVLTDSPLTVEDRLEGLVTFVSFADTASVKQEQIQTISLGGMDMSMTMHIDNAVRLRADLSPDRSKFVELEGGGDLNLQYTPQGDLSLSGRYTLSGGVMKYSLPLIPLKEFQLTNGSYVDWRGNPMNPTLNLKATERMRASVADGENGGSRMVNFDVSISIRNSLEAPELIFDITAPDDATIENELQAMGAEERSKQAIAMMATGIYLNNSGANGLNMGSALNSVLQKQINALAGSALESVNASFSVGVEDRTASETGDKQTDYSFRYSQRFFNDRVQIVIGGKVSTGNNATNDVESFIDNISLEYRLDTSGTRYVRVFHDKNYESVLDGEITETGIGLVLRKKMDRLGELFIFKKKKKIKE